MNIDAKRIVNSIIQGQMHLFHVGEESDLDAEFDSLDWIEFVMALEDKYQIAIDDSQMQIHFETYAEIYVRDVVDYVARYHG